MKSGALYTRAKLPYRGSDGTGKFSEQISIAPQEHDIWNGRALAEQHGEKFALDVQGFQLVQLASAVADSFDEAQVTGQGFREVADLLLGSVPGAHSAYVFDHAVRTGGARLSSAPAGTQYYGALVHCDCTVRSGWTRARDQALGSNEVLEKYGHWPCTFEAFSDSVLRPDVDTLFRAEQRDHNSPKGTGREFMVVNVWRPLATVENYPLALCDARSMAQDDVHPTWLRRFGVSSNDGTGIDGRRRTGVQQQSTSDVAEEESESEKGEEPEFRTGEVLTPLFSEEHRWVSFPRMSPDEALLLKTFDSRQETGTARFHCHAAFKDSEGTVGAHRESIEFRCVVFLEHGAAKAGATAGTGAAASSSQSGYESKL